MSKNHPYFNLIFSTTIKPSIISTLYPNFVTNTAI